MLGGLKHKKGRILNAVGLRKTQEGKDFQAKLAEIEWHETQEGSKFWDKSAASAGNGVTARRTNHD